MAKLTVREAQELVVQLLAHKSRGDVDASADLLILAGARTWDTPTWGLVLGAAITGFHEQYSRHLRECEGRDPAAVFADWPMQLAARR